MRTQTPRPNLVLALTCLLAVLLFFLDVAVPRAHLWGSFLLPIVLVFLWGRRRDIYIVAALVGVLLAATFWIGGMTTGGEFLAGGLLRILVLLGVAWLLAQRRQQQEELDGQVKACTAELKTSEERYRTLFNQAGDGIFSADAAGRYVEVNDRYCQMLGRTRAEIVGTNVSDMTVGITPDFFAAVGEELKQHGSATFERELRHKDGSFPEVEVTVAPLTGGGRMAIVHDIAPRKVAAREMARLAAIVQSSNNAIISTDLDGTLRSLNPAAEQLFNLPAAEAIGRHISHLGPYVPEPERHAMVARLAAGDTYTLPDFTWTTPGGRRVDLSVTALPIVGSDGQAFGMAAIARDITARRKVETALRQSEQKWRSVFEFLPVGLSVVDSREQVTDSNHALAQILGMTPEGIEQGKYVQRRYFRPALTLMPPEEFPSVRALREGQMVLDEVIGVEKEDGELIWVSVSATPESIDGYALTVTVDISERKRLEAERLALLERWNLAAEIGSIGFWDWRAGSDVVIWDERMCLLHGLAPGTTVTFAAWRSLMHPEDCAAVVASSCKAVLEHTQLPVEYRVVLPDGSLRHLLSFGGALYDAAGTAVRQLGISMDITERKRDEEQLRASEEKFARFFAANPAAMCVTRRSDAVYLEVNAAYLEMTGYTRDELIGRPYTAFGVFPAVYRADLQAVVLAEGRVHNVETQIVGKSSAPIDSLVSVETIEVDGAPCSLTMLVDISKRKRAEAALAASEAQLREAYQRLRLGADAADIGIWNWNFADDSLEWDDRICDLYDVPPAMRAAGLYQQFWRARVHPHDMAAIDSSLSALRQVGSEWSASFRIVWPDGQVRHIYSACVVDQDAHGAPLRMVGINRDITDQVRYEQLLQDTNAVLERRVVERTADLQSALTNLRRANKLKDEFMSMISHELRTPLTGVLSMSELLAEQVAGPLNARQATYVRGILRSGERLLAIINGILGYTHLLSGKLELRAERCELGDLLAICAASQEHKAAEKQQTIGVRVAPPDLAIAVDATAVAEVLKRLLDNAVKFTPDGGEIGLEAHRGAAPCTVDLVVWDTGIGIASDQHEPIFHAFTQADSGLARSHEGIGMGLAYVDQMVQLMGGTLTLASELGKGSRFTVTLPA